MTDRHVDLDAALERVIAAARAHLEAIRAADGAPDDDAVWHTYVVLNNASHDYDELLNAVYGEVTPWDLESISADEEDSGSVATLISSDVDTAGAGDDPYPDVISVRQRRDYRVPSVVALLRLAEEGRPSMGEDETYEPITTVAEAVVELMQSGDGSLGMLDVPELDPLAGVTIVAEVAEALDLDAQAGPDTGSTLTPPAMDDAPFRLGPADRVVHRFNERALED
jgi:hypothetical protein